MATIQHRYGTLTLSKTFEQSVPAPRRVKVFYIPLAMMQKLLHEGQNFRCMRGIPKDGHIVGMQEDIMRDAFAIAVEHPSFDPVQLNTHAPGEWVVLEATDEAQ